MVDVILVLEKLQEINLIRLHKITGNYYTMYCPFHNNGNERRPSFGVLIREEVRNSRRYPAGFAHCFTCGYAKPLIEFVSDLLSEHQITQTGLEWLQNNIPGFTQDVEYELLVPDTLMDSLNSKFAVDYMVSLQQGTTSYVSEEELQKYRFTVPYMYERKLTDAVIAEYDVGFDPTWIPPGRKRPVPCITFPVRDKEGRTLFFCRRSIEGKMYNYPEGVSKPLYGIDRIPAGCKSLLVCESCINALTARVYGYNAVALLGTGNPLQVQQLKELNVHELVLCLDGDEGGRKATERLKRQLRSSFMIWTVPIPDGKDVNDLTKDEFDALYNQRE